MYKNAAVLIEKKNNTLSFKSLSFEIFLMWREGKKRTNVKHYYNF